MSDQHHPARFWHEIDDGRIQCDVCPRYCKLHDGQRGMCFVRKREGPQLVLTTYGRSSGFCVDPIEKKPLNHFLPGSSVLSFGTAGCNLACRFCQNWDISKSREFARLCDSADPETIADSAARLRCASVAFTYNDPVIFLEYADDTALACHERGLATVAVTAGYITETARADFFRNIDAVNVDLKSFKEDFYWKICGGHLEPILDTLKYLVHETKIWTEITTLLIPGHNDSEAEVDAACAWILEHLGQDVPVHFTAFHPDFRMRDIPPTPLETVRRARRQAISAGLRYVYTGNVYDTDGGTTYCPSCGQAVIVRNGYDITTYHLDDDGRCLNCKTAIPGRYRHFNSAYGNRRQPVHLEGAV
ncbi:MAG: AmmeMemoRadiSam system radical SAM enzyme [Gammaproteobacteria bacterium]|nr:AmmeMemoRadiSam system radical SAM enzyme [Gammaproteobacteria bacterium]